MTRGIRSRLKIFNRQHSVREQATDNKPEVRVLCYRFLAYMIGTCLYKLLGRDRRQNVVRTETHPNPAENRRALLPFVRLHATHLFQPTVFIFICLFRVFPFCSCSSHWEHQSVTRNQFRRSSSQRRYEVSSSPRAVAKNGCLEKRLIATTSLGSQWNPLL